MAVGDCGIVRLASGSGINNADVVLATALSVRQAHRCGALLLSARISAKKFCELTRDDATKSRLFIIQ